MEVLVVTILLLLFHFIDLFIHPSIHSNLILRVHRTHSTQYNAISTLHTVHSTHIRNKANQSNGLRFSLLLLICRWLNNLIETNMRSRIRLHTAEFHRKKPIEIRSIVFVWQTVLFTFYSILSEKADSGAL